ncbi:MAG: sigma-70 family RNA polymerase sigma factor [Bacteroidota bacterium]
MSTDFRKQSDEEIIRAILEEGRTELFGILYDRYSDKVFRKCISFVRDKDMAQDMAQDVLLKVFTQLNKFKGKSRFSTWLYAITYNFCVEYYRRNSRYGTVDIDEGPELSEDSEDDKDLLDLRVEKLKGALEKVSAEDKMILLMKYQDDASIRELMEQLEISESAVKMRLARARSRVKQIVVDAEKKSAR